uniref:Neural cell adhesion molecule L1 n=1 Tax=Neogobius melanostomus TaxID=47308 RepID=A0A8C6U311_9GOBI
TGEVTNHGRWFHFESVEQSDDGEYQCRVHNEHGETSHSFTVTVEAAPYWVKEPQNLMYAPRENVRLDCQAEGIPTPTITWTMNGQSLSEVDADQRRSVSGGVLKLLDVEVADTAVYQCEAKNKHGSILLNTYINVVELPAQILTADGLQYRVTEGGDVALQCETFGSPQPHELSPLLSHYHVSLLTDGTLEVVNVSQTYSGVYVCSVEESNISISAHLEVYERSLVLAGPQTLRAPRGSTALLRCEAFTDPRLKHERQIVWRRDGAKILEFTVFHNGTLRVTDVRPKDSGVYSCEVITSLDHAQAEGAISVVGTWSMLRSLETTEFTCHTLISSPLTETHFLPEFIVESREEQHTEEARWRWEELKRVPGDFREVELKLHPFCTYRFRVTAVNDLGRSEASEASDYHDTPPAIPSSSPSNVRSDSSEPGTLVVTWDEMEKRLHNGQGFKYKVWWREAGGHDTRWNSSYVDRPPFSVTGTGTYTPFEIKVQAVNSLGEGPEPEAERGHSGEDVPLEAPGGVDVTVMNSTVRVKWNEAQNVRGLLLGYKVQLQHPSTAPQTVPFFKSEITGLKLYSVYKLSVTAFNSKGEGPRSKPHGFETPEGAPGPPASLMFESPTDTSLVLFWTPPTETNGVLLGYIVQYQQGKSQSDPSTTHIELQSLDSSSYYLVNVRARTAAGDGPAVTRRFATLLDGVPPSNISMYLGDTYFNMSWVPGERDRNHGFHIRYLRKAETWQDSELVNSTQGFYSLSGLQPGTIYHLQILHQNNTQWERIVQTEGPGTSESWGLSETFPSSLPLHPSTQASVWDKEADSEARPMKDETFGEYSDADEKRSDSQPSICASKLGSDDSLAEYGDSVDIQFNEDGSFIGQYSGRGPPRPATRARGPPLPPPSSLRPPSLPPCPPSCTDPAKHPTALNTQGSARELQ